MPLERLKPRQKQGTASAQAYLVHPFFRNPICVYIIRAWTQPHSYRPLVLLLYLSSRIALLILDLSLIHGYA